MKKRKRNDQGDEINTKHLTISKGKSCLAERKKGKRERGAGGGVRGLAFSLDSPSTQQREKEMDHSSQRLRKEKEQMNKRISPSCKRYCKRQRRGKEKGGTKCVRRRDRFLSKKFI